MTDRIVLANLAFTARHGVEPREKTELQRFELDVELELDLAPAGRADDLAMTANYAEVDDVVRAIVEGPPFDLLEALAETIAAAVLASQPLADAAVVRVRKPEVRLGGPLDHAAVEIRRTRQG
ncbi:MAG TPA: dihydroneopterin aldolase [Candidatus Limnocylindrales bacterium]